MRAPAVLLALVCLLSASAGFAQVAASEAMPAGWRNLPADEFLAMAEPLLISDSSDVLTMSEHAWTIFLNDPEFVSDADLTIVLKMLLSFGRQRDSVDAAAVQTLRERINGRLGREEGTFPVMDLYELTDAAKAFRGIGRSMVENAPLFVEWMTANDWRSLDASHLYNLYGFVNADAVDRRHFSARWTGTISASHSAEFTFEQARVYRGDDCRIKLWIGGALVLDSSGETPDAAAYTSSPVSLQGNQPAPFRVELTHNTAEIEYSVSAPMALIAWSSEGMSSRIIPSSVFSPPEGTAEAGTEGLLGEYFSDESFTDLRVSRIDPTLDMIWSWPPAAPAETQAAREVFSELVARLLDDAYMNSIAQASSDVVALEFDRNLWRIAYRMSGTERLKLIDVLRRNPGVLRTLSPEAIGRLYRGIYMLPGSSHWELVGEWAMSQPQPRCQPGWYPGWGEGSYQKLNTDFYWAIGHMMQGSYAKDAEALCDAYLTRPNGECCLQVAYIAAYADSARVSLVGNSRQVTGLVDRLNIQLADESNIDDQRVTWLLARAFFDEVFWSDGLELKPDSEYLIEACLVAMSDDYSFWAKQEKAARYTALGRVESLEKFVGDMVAGSPAQSEAIRQWRETADFQQAALLKRQQEQASRQTEWVREELERRKAFAQQRGNESSTSRYQNLLDRAATAGAN